ncbi:hypothetical protein ACFYX5_31995 [Streptomyces rubiginosohelvolus]|uniref:hypothetical protein n=1 Tax=Streptomyces rubiginosohelvolus TaxID=67362 RepID=UPI0036A75367
MENAEDAADMDAARSFTHPRTTAQQAVLQADSWYGLGGRDLLLRYGENLGKLMVLGPKAQQSSNGDALVKSPPSEPSSGSSSRTLKPVSRPGLADPAKLDDVHDTAARNSEDCLTAVSQKDGPLLGAGIENLNQARRSAETINAWVAAGRTARP